MKAFGKNLITFILQGQGPRDKFTEVTEKSGGSTPFLGGGLLSCRLWGQRGPDQFPAILLGGTGKILRVIIFCFGMAINSPHSQCCVNYITSSWFKYLKE